MEKKLVEVRCPFQKKATSNFAKNGHVVKKGELYNCSFLCTKVYPGSSGEAFCSSCKLSFEFEVGSQETPTTSIPVKSTK